MLALLSILSIHQKTWYKTMLRLTKELFIPLLSFRQPWAIMANVSKFTTFISLNNQQCMARYILIVLNSDE